MGNEAAFNILILGREPDRLVALENLLRRPGRVVESLDLAHDYVAAAGRVNFGLAVLDAVSHSEDAIVAVRALRDRAGLKKLPVLLVINEFQEAWLPHDLGPVDLTPYSPEIIEFRVDSFLKLRNQERALKRKTRKVREVEQRLEEEIRFHRETERILSENEQTLRRILRSIEASSEAILVTEKNELVYYVNPAFVELTGLAEDDVFGEPVDRAFRFKSAPAGIADIKSLARATRRWQGEAILIRKDGETCEAAMDVNAVDGLDGCFEGFIFILRDISSLKKVMAELERLARTDSLTGLFNRRYFMERFEEEVKRVKRYHTPLSVVLIDLDHFKSVNDTYGHSAGDRALEKTGAVISDLIRSMDFACRYGGEEFCLALPDTASEGAFSLAERLRKRLGEEAFQAAGEETFHISCSIGLAQVDPRQKSWDACFEAADAALYRAKQKGRNQVEAAEAPS